MFILLTKIHPTIKPYMRSGMPRH